MGYKVGDKVRIHGCEGSHWYNGKIGTVVETNRIQKTKHPRWDYVCSFDGNCNYPFGLSEMTKVFAKGEQLLLFEI